MTEGTPNPGDKPTGGEPVGDTPDRVVFTDTVTDEAFAGQVRDVARTLFGKLKDLDRAKGRDRTGDFMFYKHDGDGQMSVKGTPEEDLLLVDTVQNPDNGEDTRTLSIRTDPRGNVRVKTSEGGVSRGFTYSVDTQGVGKTTELFDRSILLTARGHKLSGDDRQTALGKLAGDINAFGDAIAAERAALPPETST